MHTLTFVGDLLVLTGVGLTVEVIPVGLVVGVLVGSAVGIGVALVG